MKIEDSPFQFATSAVDKIRRTPLQVGNPLDELDLAFLDLITAMSDHAADVPSIEKATDSGLDPDQDKLSAKAKSTDGKAAEKPSNVRYLNPRSEVDEIAAQVDEDMKLLQTELTAEDINYMKQAVIPGLPIVMGSVPFNSLFPADKSGNISYRGFDVSPKLAELIEKGYKTGRPIRVELDTHSAVVLKFRDGRVSAEFLSNDKGMVLYMQQELDDLRHRMAAKNLPVGTLEYRHSDSRGNQQRPQQDDEDTPS
jgi:hypothetical protein